MQEGHITRQDLLQTAVVGNPGLVDVDPFNGKYSGFQVTIPSPVDLVRFKDLLSPAGLNDHAHLKGILHMGMEHRIVDGPFLPVTP